MSYFRHPKTTNERRQWGSLDFSRSEQRIKARVARSHKLLVDAWDDLNRSDTQFWGKPRCWKHRKKRRQWMRL